VSEDGDVTGREEHPPGNDPGAPGGHLGRNPVNGKLAIDAPARARRTQAAGAAAPAAAQPCPFCAGNEGLTPPEVDAVRPGGGPPDSPGWRIRVVPNKYPALAGRHEVVVHSPGHDVEVEDLDEASLLEVLEMWRRRIAWQLADGAAAATLIYNRGAGAGASQPHPHAQLFATPVVPPLLLDELAEFERFRNRYGGCVLCNELETAGARLVHGGEVAAWVPAAMRFSHELWLAPRVHEADVRDADLAPLAAALGRALAAVHTATGGAPLNFWLHTAPAELRGPFHWHLEVAPRLSGIAGFELGTDIALVAADPATAAAALRAAWPQA
jgi:UDPglucose--hexose-1-phosphate uridylyltransferase